MNLFLMGLLAIGCGDDKDGQDSGHHHDHGDGSLPDDFDPTQERATEDGLYTVTYVTVPEPMPDSTEFALTITVDDADATITDVDATMPSHGGHGMNVVPVVTDNGDGTFTAEPLKFHMPGYWVIHVDVIGSQGSDRANFDVDCCD